MNYKKIMILSSLLLLVGCSSIEKKEDIKLVETHNNSKMIEEVAVKNKEYLKLDLGKEIVPQPVIGDNEVVRKKEINGTKFIEVYDPLEPLNRRIYYFNYYLDKFVLIPAVNVYEFIAPTVVQKGVSNFFSNLQEINTFVNSLLQLEGRKATITLARFGINSTIGILGLFDVATKLELPKTYEDFGLTLAKYGIGNGPYLVLPGFGPSNLRDTTGKAVGMVTIAEVDPYNPVDVNVDDWGIRTANVINARKETKKFRYYGTGSPFEYEYVRYFYTKYRDTLIDVNDVNGRGE
ncbi:VacJ family lipoprotein [Cetobacterium sp. 8H]|uniref:MlaA family lipoprotein n=1 Tax=Cetobacterium sp. 8H TaxID=2759681 RepID=UPI00163C3C2B|nr:VacJ family lipoprotein [Cetobacterium sp. 8H]MBC2851659.1 VacJ family lipoprotein [Cetobacterium sp. 8H]